MKLNISGEDCEGVIPGVEFLRKVNLGELTRIEGHAVVVGGGDVAIDAARSALRLGAEKVTIIYRRTRSEMPARDEEIEDALAEGIGIQYLTAPQSIHGESGKVIGIQCIQMELGKPDESGRRRPVPLPDSEFIMNADVVIPAIGQTPDSTCLAAAGVNVSRKGTVEADELTFATNVPGVFAGGDAQSGPWIAISAVAAGKEAAVSISRYLKGQDIRAGREKVEVSQNNFLSIPKDIEKRPRARMRMLPKAERQTGFTEVVLGFADEQAAQAEAKRCLNCMACCECLQCVSACKAEAIDHSMQEQTFTIKVGSIIAAPGFKVYDPSDLTYYAYATEPNVITAKEFERMLSAGGPFKGHVQRLSDGREPKKIAWLQCIGSRSMHAGAHTYCSSVCCMYALKQSMIARDHVGPDLETTIFFMDMRTYRKDFEKYYENAKVNGSRLIRCKVHSVEPVKDTGDLRVRYVTEDGKPLVDIFDMVVLSVGMEIPNETVELARKLGIDLTPHNFVKSSCFTPLSTSRPGIYACGVFNGAKDIPMTVMEGSGAASVATDQLGEARGTLDKKKTFPPEKDLSDEPSRVGVFVCNCGINIGGVADVPAIVEFAKSIPGVQYAQENLFTCSQDAQDQIVEMIKAHNLNRVVVAACTPSTHESIFQGMMRNAGLNKYLFEMANIRNQCTWCHQQEPELATQKCKDLVNMAVAKARLLEPLEYLTADVNRNALVVGGGVTGMKSALGLAQQGYGVHLVEMTDCLGGNALDLHTSWKGEVIRPYVENLVDRMYSHPKIHVHLHSMVKEASGFVGNFKSKLSNGEQIDHGVVVFATGAEPYRPEGQYLYGKNPNVLLSLELDGEFMNNSLRLKNAESVAFIQCVGSRIPERPYCNKLCCSHSVENALKLKEMKPDMDVFIVYRDLRTYGQREDLNRKAREKGVIFIRYTLNDLPKVEEVDGRIKITTRDHVLNRPVEFSVDLLVLASAIIPHDNKSLAELYKVSLNAEGFFAEAHAKIRPVDAATAGIFLAGLCHFPKPIEDSIAEARATAARASTILSKDTLELGSIISHPIDANCDGCAFCIEPCPFKALTLLEYMKNGDIKKTVEVNEFQCKGCGSCMATCPKQGIFVAGFSAAQLGAQVEAALGLIWEPMRYRTGS